MVMFVLKATAIDVIPVVIPGRPVSGKIDCDFVPERVSPESITTVGGYGFRPCAPSGAHPGMTTSVDRPDQRLDLVGVRAELFGKLVQIGVGDLGKTRLVDIIDDLHAH